VSLRWKRNLTSPLLIQLMVGGLTNLYPLRVSLNWNSTGDDIEPDIDIEPDNDIITWFWLEKSRISFQHQDFLLSVKWQSRINRLWLLTRLWHYLKLDISTHWYLAYFWSYHFHIFVECIKGDFYFFPNSFELLWNIFMSQGERTYCMIAD